MTIYRILPALAILLVLAGCKTTTISLDPFSSGSKYDVTATRLDLTAPGARPVSVAVIDRRPYVLGGKESPKFLGTELGERGPQLTVTTASGRSLAEDLTQVATDALGRAGAEAEPFAVPAKAAEADVRAMFAGQDTDRLLLIRIIDWRTDVYTREMLQWRFEATVYDRSGVELGHSITTGKAPIGGTTIHDNAEAIALHALSQRLSNLLNARGITDALR